MKTFTLFLSLTMSLSQLVKAEIAVQRTVGSSYQDFQKYLEKNKRISFIQAYINLAAVTEMETPHLERCLEEVYIGAPAQSTCLLAVKALTSKPLNQPRREVLFSFLSKLEKSKSPNRGLYQDLKAGLLRTHSHLSKSFKVPVSEPETNLPKLQDLEMKAWKKALSKKFPIEEVALLINGKKVSRLAQWSAPEGTYQWSLVTNTHEPFVRIGTFSQFAAESLKDIKPLLNVPCENLAQADVQKYGLLRIEAFAHTKCIVQFGVSTSIAKSAHLGTITQMPQVEQTNYQKWIWPALAVIAVGAAVGLQGKTVTVEMPTFK